MMTYSTEDIFNHLIREVKRIRDADHEGNCGDGGDWAGLDALRGLLEKTISDIEDELSDIGRSY